MSWEAAGAIGEILGALLVVFTLVYLSRQIKQHGTATASGSMDAWFSDYNALVLEGFRDRENASLLQEGFTDFNGLESDRQLQFHMWLVVHILSVQNMYLQSRTNTTHAELAESVLTFNASLLKLPGAKQWWQTGKDVFHPAYVAEMNKRMEAIEAVDGAWPWFLRGDVEARNLTNDDSSQR